MRNYYFVCCFLLFVGLILLRVYAARLYRTALQAALRSGQLTRRELPQELTPWFDRLGIIPKPDKPPQGLEYVLRATFGRAWRVAVSVALALVWFVFIGKSYVGEFINFHPVVGFGNQPLVLLPTFDYIPGDLKKDANGEGRDAAPTQQPEQKTP